MIAKDSMPKFRIKINKKGNDISLPQEIKLLF